MSSNPARARAIQMLIIANVFWGLSFPVTKALTMTQRESLSLDDSWFIASLSIVYRFGLAALGMLFLSARTLRTATRLELEQGLGLGLFAGAGILFQVDGMTYTSASTSAFLTQCYCLLIPIWVACRARRRPSVRVFVCCALVIAGVTTLARVDWQTLQLGRGELETITASVLFMGQILWLDRSRYATNNVKHFSLVMFGVMALVCLPVAIITSRAAGDWLRAYSSASTLGFMGILVFLCTFGGYVLMNYWQPHVTATEAGLIYCLEPVFASLFALFLPVWLSRWADIGYASEKLTASLLIGGGLITAANVLLQCPSMSRRPARRRPAGQPDARRKDGIPR